LKIDGELKIDRAGQPGRLGEACAIDPSAPMIDRSIASNEKHWLSLFASAALLDVPQKMPHT